MDRHQVLSSQLEQVVAALRGGDHFLLVGHVNPDLDSTGSVLALDWALRKLGKNCQPVSPDPLAPTWTYLPGYERIRLPHEVNPSEWQILVVVDCEPGRTGEVATWVDHFDLVINIDHHQTNSAAIPVLLLDPDAAASGELVYRIIRSFDLTPDQDVATLLYTAIMTDTGSFRYSNTTPQTFRIAAQLVEWGANPDIIYRDVYETSSWGYLQLLREALGTLARSADGKIAWLSITAQMLALDGLRKDESEGLIQYPRMIEGVEVALVFRELGPKEVRVGLRSKERIDVSSIAQEFGGGGHARAAGCTVYKPLAEARVLVLESVQSVMVSFSL